MLAGCEGSPPIEFDAISSPAPPGSTAPHLAVSPARAAVLSWLEPAPDGGHALRYARLDPDGWSAPQQIATGQDWFINHADIPSVVPIDAEHWAAHWLVRRPGGTYAYDIALAISSDRGVHWGEPLMPHTDDTATEHGFVSLFPWRGNIGAVWLDGRNMAPDSGGGPPAKAPKDGGMTLRYAEVDYAGKLRDDGVIDERVCECCQTDIALTKVGPVVAYRDRSAEEVRDIAVARYADGQWSEPVTVSDDRWRIAGCPVNGPAIAARGDRVIVAWYGAPNRQRRVKVAWSADAGATFSAPIILDEGGARGRVDVELLGDDRAIVSWVARTGQETGQLRVREVDADGNLRPIQVVANGSYSRNTGFPHMVRATDGLLLAWPEAGEPARLYTSFAHQPGD